MSTLEQNQTDRGPATATVDSEATDASGGAAGGAPDAGAGQPPGASDAAAEVDEEHPPSPTDADFVRVFKRGALLGTPLVFVLMGLLMLVATPSPAVLLAAAWAALMGGWYFGAMIVLAAFELRGQGRHLPTLRRRARTP